MRPRIRKMRIITKSGRIILEEDLSSKTEDIQDIDTVIDLIRLVSNESRYKIMRLIAEKQAISFTELHQLAGYSQKTIAQALDDLLRIRAISKEYEGYMLSIIGKLLLSKLMEIASIIKKVKELQDLELDFDF
jgi:DNA-binding transcriptional ArsR family regulator